MLRSKNASTVSTTAGPSRIARDVALGLGRRRKTLPPYLFYDEAGSALYERITELPEYYLTRAEREIFETHADAIVTAARRGTSNLLHVVELGAGTATKSQIILAAVVRAQGHCLYLPVDVSQAPLEEAARRLRRQEPRVSVRPLVVPHEQSFDEVRRIGPRRLVMFIGSSIGNYDDHEAVALLHGVARSLAPGGALLLGTDWRKDPAEMIPAYDDAQGVTAAFNRNVLAHINRTLNARFQLERFRHVALWNDTASRIEMHLESTEDQLVPIHALGIEIRLSRGERIHTESSVKYDMPRIDRLLGAAGFRREQTYFDRGHRFAVHLARVPESR